MDMNVTLSLEDEIVRKVRRIASAQDTTLTGLVRDYVVQLAATDDADDRKVRNRANLERLFNRHNAPPSSRTWTRAELYDRGR